MSTLSLEDRRRQHAAALARHDQQHLLAFWDELSDAQRAELLDDLDQIDLDLCTPLIEPFVRQRPKLELPTHIEPPEILPAVADAAHADQYRRAREAGEAAIRAGQVAAFTVAGGQGTRLGFDGPKGAFRISPIRDACLFQLFAEYLLGIERRYGRRPAWYIMTSPVNHAATTAFFEENSYFGLPRDGVRFFTQGQMPAFLPDGRIVLAEKHRVALSPDGHGGSLRALARSGALAEMRAAGVEHIGYFQVDNPLVHVIDPLFVGLHILSGSEMSSKALPKAYDKEPLGNFCIADERLTVIEYSDLPDELATARNADGSRKFDAGSIAIHVLRRDFVERLTADLSHLKLPWHRADKKVPHVDAAGQAVKPESPNAVKLEMFVFDALPLAERPLVMYTRREEEFSPVKNAEGLDSPATTRRDLVRRAARWLEAAGVTVPRGADGEPAATIEISPAYAVDADDLRARLSERPTIVPGRAVLLEDSPRRH